MTTATVRIVHRRLRQRTVNLGAFILGALPAPPLLLVGAWQTSSVRQKRLLITLFFLLYGSTIALAFNKEGIGSDGVRHLLRVHLYYLDMDLGQYLDQLWTILMFRETGTHSSDVYIHTLSYLVGSVVGVPNLFFPIVAIVYGWFFSGSILEIYRGWPHAKKTLFLVGFAGMLFLVRNIEGVNTVRTWTGLWILVYGCVRYFRTGRRRYLAYLLLPPLVHFAYFIMVLPAVVAIVLGPRIPLYSVLFVLSSFTTFVNPGSVVQTLEQTELGANRSQVYYTEVTLDAQARVAKDLDRDVRWWLTLEAVGVQKWALNFLVYVLLLTGVFARAMNREQRGMLSVGLLTLVLSNAAWYLYALSNRSWIVGAVFVLSAFVMTMLNPETSRRLPTNSHVYRIGLYLSLLLFVPYFLYNLSTLLDYPSVFLIGFPFVVWLAPELNTSVKAVLQEIIYSVI